MLSNSAIQKKTEADMYPKGFNVLVPLHGPGCATWYTPFHQDSGPMLYIMDDFGNAYSPVFKSYA